MLGKLLNAVFGCWHLRYSFPMTLRPGSGRRKASVITVHTWSASNAAKSFPMIGMQ